MLNEGAREEAFAYLTRWIPVDDRPKRKRLATRPQPPAPILSRLVKGGAVGLAVLAAAQFLWRAAPPPPNDARPHDDESEPS